MSSSSGKIKEVEEVEAKSPFTLSVPRVRKNVLITMAQDDLNAYFKKQLDSGLEADELPKVYIFPTAPLEDGTFSYVPGGAPTQGTYVYGSMGILREADMIAMLPSLNKLPSWKLLFTQLTEEQCKEKYPIYMFSAESAIQNAFVNLISIDLLRAAIEAVKADTKSK